MLEIHINIALQLYQLEVTKPVKVTEVNIYNNLIDNKPDQSLDHLPFQKLL